MLENRERGRKHIFLGVISITIIVRQHSQCWLCLLMRGFSPFTVGLYEQACPDQPQANWSNLMLHLAELGRCGMRGANSSRKCFTAGFVCGSSKLAAITAMSFSYYECQLEYTCNFSFLLWDRNHQHNVASMNDWSQQSSFTASWQRSWLLAASPIIRYSYSSVKWAKKKSFTQKWHFTFVDTFGEKTEKSSKCSKFKSNF